jgi:hypothetical protein
MTALLFLAGLAAVSAVPSQPARSTAAGHETVVVGVPIAQLQLEAERCAHGGCTPREDIIASIRYAEGLFRSGGYAEARKVLQRTARRVAPAEAQEPIAVSELYYATATVARHDGEQAVVRSAIYDSARVLREHLPPDAAPRLAAELDVADLIADGRYARQAMPLYRRTMERAREAGQAKVAALATVRMANLAYGLRRDGEGTALLQGLLKDPSPDMAGFRIVARVLIARNARQRGNKDANEALFAALASGPRVPAPLLIWSPPFPYEPDPSSRDPFDPRRNSQVGSSDVIGIGWADIGFLIRPDGRVDQAEWLRGNRDARWARALVAIIGQRRYAPFGRADDVGTYRVERLTLTADYGTPVGSLIRRRAFRPHWETLDITGADPGEPAPTPAAQTTTPSS